MPVLTPTSTFMPEEDVTGLASVPSWEKLSSSHTTFLTNRGPDCDEVRPTLADRREEEQRERLLQKKLQLQTSQLQKPRWMKMRRMRHLLRK